MSDPAIVAAQRVSEVAHMATPPLIAVLAAREMAKPIRELHRPARFEVCDTGPFCPTCDIGWPCATAKLIYTSEELEQ